MSEVCDWIAFDLRIRSVIAIPGAMPILAPGAPDIEITYGTGELGDILAAEGPYRVGQHGFEFAMPGVARYLCLGGERMLIDPDPTASEDDIAAMLVATALPASLWSRGEVVLHAAAFTHQWIGGAVAVAGPSGIGKSTVLAQQLAKNDGRVIADDSLCLRLLDRSVIGSGLPGGYHGPVTTGGSPRDFVLVPPTKQFVRFTFGHLLILTPGLTDPVALRGADAFHAMLVNRHRPRISRLMGREATMLPKIAEICRSITVHAVPSRSDDIVSSCRDIFDIHVD